MDLRRLCSIGIMFTLLLVVTALGLALSHTSSAAALQHPLSLALAPGATMTPTVYLPLIQSDYADIFTSFPACNGTLQTDDFNDPGSGWPVDAGYGYLMEYTNGEYRVVSNSGRRLFNGWSASDFWISVKARKTADYDGYYGLVFGQNTNEDIFEFYVFWINSLDGSYRLELLTPNPEEGGLWYGSSSAINLGSQTNILAVERFGGWITLWVNGIQIDQIYDNTNTGARLVGLGTMNVVQDAFFDDFVLCTFDN